jgi:hypothetical protein
MPDVQIGLDSQGMPPGLYTFSMFLKANYAAELIITVGPRGTNTQSLSRRIESADSLQRIEFPFYYAGNGSSLAIGISAFIPTTIAPWPSGSFAPGEQVVSGGNVYLCTAGGTSTTAQTGIGSGITAGGTALFNFVGPGTVFTPYTNAGLWMINKGSRAAPYVFSQNADSAATLGWVPRIYYGTAAPTSSVYQVGDICYNTSPAPGYEIGWVCVSPAAEFKSFGTISN